MWDAVERSAARPTVSMSYKRWASRQLPSMDQRLAGHAGWSFGQSCRSVARAPRSTVVPGMGCDGGAEPPLPVMVPLSRSGLGLHGSNGFIKASEVVTGSSGLW